MGNKTEELEKQLDGMTDEQIAALMQEVAKQTKDYPFIPNPGPQTEAYFSKADIVLYGGQPAGGKRGYINTPVPVPYETDPSGFKKHGELRFGDKVFRPDGTTALVLVSHPVVEPVEAYEIEFDTGEKIKCDAGHLWWVMDRNNRQRELKSTPDWREKRRASRPSRAKENPKNAGSQACITKMNKCRRYNIIQPEYSIKTARDLYKTQRINAENRMNYTVDVTKSINLPDIDLPVDPYLFGLWLGDGMTHRDQISMMVDDWLDIDKHLPTPRWTRTEGVEKGRAREFDYRAYNELKYAKTLGDKHIPSIYLRASYKQRLSLLRGMMDTDGTCNERGQCELGFSNKRLAEDALELLCTLGIKSSLTKKTFKKKEHKDHYRMKFMTDEIVFNLSRKAGRQKPAIRNGITKRRYIKSIVPCDPVPMNCISVDGGLYCMTRSFIATHNSALGIGLALNEHYRSLIVRKNFSDLEGIMDNAKKLAGTKDGFIGGTRPKMNKKNGGVIHFAGLAEDGGIGGHQGVDHDFIYIDECAQITEDSVRILMGWLRTEREGQRCRVVFGSNPPLDARGDWMMDFFAPWFRPGYPNPAQPGELRWFLPDEETGDDVECNEGDYIMFHGSKLYAQSRTYIPSKFTDNPYYDPEAYSKTLAVMPKEQRNILLSGSFLVDRPDGLWQLFPSDWVDAAVQRWETMRPQGVDMSAIGVDVAQGGGDNTVLSRRHDCWFDQLIIEKGVKTPEGPDVAALVVRYRRNNCTTILDMGGGFGGGVKTALNSNGIKPVEYKGNVKTKKKDKLTGYGFKNVRSFAYWDFRLALDPDQDGGSRIALPPDPDLIAELKSIEYRQESGIYAAESKKEYMKRLGRSPDKMDAVIMSWYDGPREMTSYHPAHRMGGNLRDLGGGSNPRVLTRNPNRGRR